MMDSGSVKNNTQQAGPFQFRAGELILHLYIQPGAGRTKWAGRHGDSELKLRVAAPPVEGKANQACLKYIAKFMGVPKSSVTLVRGERSRSKVFRIAPMDGQKLQALKEQWQLT